MIWFRHLSVLNPKKWNAPNFTEMVAVYFGVIISNKSERAVDSTTGNLLEPF